MGQNDCEYNAYVDASGDNGFKFEKNSSLCYVVNVLLCKQKDDDFNKNKLAEIKKLLGCKENCEIKYSTLRRHKKSREAHKLLGQIKGRLLFYVVFKKKLPRRKFETGITHSFPIDHIPSIVEAENVLNVFIIE